MREDRGGGQSKGESEAICLLSGGLDSALAAKLVLEQGIKVHGVHFIIPFGRLDKEGPDLPVSRVAESLGIELEMIRLGEEFLEIVRQPKHGFGSNANPCIDCKILMLRMAGELMRNRGADFVVTGEVVGQRPMSQRMDSMRRIEKESGLEGYLVRPLSAHLLEPTRPETEGLVRREELLGIQGRSRKDLMRFAAEKGIRGYSSPAGGCLLTDPRYAERVKDLLEHEMLTLHDVDLLSVGRHFRLPGGSKLVVGRHKRDNDVLSRLAGENDCVLTTPAIPGPTAVLRGRRIVEDEHLAARIVARYSDAGDSDKVVVLITGGGREVSVEVDPLVSGEAAELMI
jgi:tRNA U34 2-thiouridine synthase MnmA/TrmU